MFIVEETNRYAEKYINTNQLTARSMLQNWRETNYKEIKCFLGLLLLQSIVQKPVESWFWSERPILNTPFFGKVMSEDRYALLMKFLHFENSDDFDPQNHPNPKLRKIYSIYAMLMQKFKAVYIPNQEISIDESLIAHKGLLGFKQYTIPKKRFGIKLFNLCESESGYIWNSLIYTGKDTIFMSEYENHERSTKIVMTLIHDLKGQGYLVTTDNYYTSPELAELLLNCRTDICGTLRASRGGLPQRIKNEKVKKGEILAFQKGKMCAMKWNDKKPIFVLSTVHNASFIDFTNKYDNKAKQKPAAIVDYRRTMRGVKKSDQSLSYYPRNHKHKCYKNIFRSLIYQSVWNSFIIFKKVSGVIMTRVNFRRKLLERLIEEGGSIREPCLRGYDIKYQETVTRLTGRHFPTNVENKTKALSCVVCTQKKNENGKRVHRQTRFQCEECNVGLCAVPCFEIYHTNHDF